MTYPLCRGNTLDALSIRNFKNLLQPYIQPDDVAIVSKSKVDEYLLFGFDAESEYNLKLGDSGRTFDLKMKLNNDVMNEQWSNVAKGNMSTPNDLGALKTALSSSVTPDKDPTGNLARVMAALEADGEGLVRAFTAKTLNTLTIPGSSAWLHTFKLEQIDFCVWAKETETEAGAKSRRCYRSVSLEGKDARAIPEQVLNALLQLLAPLEASGLPLVYGGFPGMLKQVLGHPTFPNQYFEASYLN